MVKHLTAFDADVLDRLHVAVIFTDVEGRVVACNSHTETLYGWARDELIGRRTDELAAELPDDGARAERTAQILAGDAWESDLTARRKGGSTVVVHAIDSPFIDDDGTITGVVRVSFDVTRHRRDEGVHRFLAEASGVLMSSLDYGESLKRLARLTVPFLGDLCLIDVTDGTDVRRMAAVHADPDKQPLVDLLAQRYPPDPFGEHPVVKVMQSGQASYSGEMSEEFLRATTRDDEHLRIVLELGFTSYMCLPLIARGNCLGTLTLVSSGSGRVFGPDDVAIAEDLAWRAALAVDNARLYSERAYVARTLQASLLPHSLPDIPGMEIASRYLAAGEGNEVGGDFFDAFDLGYGTWAVIVGDVCGKGADAAAVAGLARHTVRAAALKERRPSRMLATLNEAILREDMDDARFCTVCAALLRPRPTGARLTIAMGGHPLPWLLRANGRVEQAGVAGLLIGVFDDAQTRDDVVELAPGDAVVLYTDGVVEERNDTGETFGQDRLRLLLEGATGLSAPELVDAVVTAVVEFGGHEPRDDVAVVAARVLPG